MNRLTITRNGTTVDIEQKEPISAEVIVSTIEAIDRMSVAPVPFIPQPYINPLAPYPYPQQPYIWTCNRDAITKTNECDTAGSGTLRVTVQDMAKMNTSYTLPQ